MDFMRKIPRQARDLEICCGSGGAIMKTDHQEKFQTGREHEVGSLSAPLLDFDLNREIQQLRSEGRWQSGHTAKTLVKYPDFRLVLVAIKAGGRLVRHRTEGRISVHNLVGHIRLHSPEQAVELPAGHMLALERDIPHDVEALIDSAFLLTIAWPSSSSVAIQDENSV
jgi:quercetin dioxygenase-like cupin family protein